MLARINGFSSPVFGISWQPPTADANVARKVVAFLEDRRVLYNGYEFERPDRCVESVQQIRAFLSSMIQDGRIDKELAGILRSMRAACRHFLDVAEPRLDSFYPHLDVSGSHFPLGLGSWVHFTVALGELRGSFGFPLVVLATRYGIEIEANLKTILPNPDE
jgi:hypothetical protein